jgi:hypothetical protein
VWVVLGFAFVLADCKCNGTRLNPAKDQLVFGETSIDFGDVYLGASHSRALDLRNNGLAPAAVTMTLDDSSGSFSAKTLSLTVGVGEATQVALTFTPLTAGRAEAQLHASWDEGTATVFLVGGGLAPPDCSPTGPCDTAAFDPDAGVCNRGLAPNGTACTSNSTCLDHTQCLDGNCVGTTLDCSDNSVCTRDYCVEGTGCVHQDSSSECQGTNPCQSFSCDPTRGCVSASVPDGTPCSLNDSCQRAEICLAGQCTGTPVPDGTPCQLPWAPCITDGTCTQGTCGSPTASQLQPGQVLWQYAPDGGDGFGSFGSEIGFAVDESGSSYVLIEDAFGQGISVFAISNCGRPRWQTPIAGFWDGAPLIVDRDQLLVVTSDAVWALLTADGSVLWQHPLAPDLGFCVATDAGVVGPGAVESCDGGFLIEVSASQAALARAGRLDVSGVVGLEGESFFQREPFVLSLLTTGNPEWAQLQPAFWGPKFLDTNNDSDAYPQAEMLIAPDDSLVMLANESMVTLDLGGSVASDIPLGPVDSQYDYLNAAGDGGAQIDHLWVASQQGVSILGSSPFDGGMAAEVTFAESANGEVFPSAGAVVEPDGTLWMPLYASSVNGAAALRLFTDGGSDLLDLTGGEGCSDSFVHQLVVATGGVLSLSTVSDGGLCVPALREFSSSGTLMWSTTLPTNGDSIGVFHPSNPSLALLPYGTAVVALPDQLEAVFVGQQGMPANSPWPRWRGDNANTSRTPQTTNGPVP